MLYSVRQSVRFVVSQLKVYLAAKDSDWFEYMPGYVLLSVTFATDHLDLIYSEYLIPTCFSTITSV